MTENLRDHESTSLEEGSSDCFTKILEDMGRRDSFAARTIQKFGVCSTRSLGVSENDDDSI